MNKFIRIRGAREHNLKNLDVDIPRDQLVVITGVSGSGKSSLAFDTIYAEGQRRYVESLSAYARQFLEQMQKPDVESIEGLSPAISIEQRTSSKNPRSTVGTVTEIYDYLRLLFARAGTVHCPDCGREIAAQTVQQMVDQILAWPEKTRLLLLAPIVRGRKGEYRKELKQLLAEGFVRIRIDGEMFELSEPIVLDKNKQHTLEVVVDRLVIKDGIASRLADSLETALKLADGLVRVEIPPSGAPHEASLPAPLPQQSMLFSARHACIECGVSLPEITPRMFSFNNPHGACSECAGLGTRNYFDPELVVPNPELSLREGAIIPWETRTGVYYQQLLEALSEHFSFSVTTPFAQLPEALRQVLLYGSGEEKVRFFFDQGGRRHFYEKPFEGVIPHLQRRYRESDSETVRESLERFMNRMPCPSCRGARLRPEALCVTIGGKNIRELCALSIAAAEPFFAELELPAQKAEIARRVLKEIRARLSFLAHVGLDYLSLDRSAATLSGGEGQRIRLATQIGSSLTGVLYILDEPSIGLHQRDNRRLLDTLKKLRDLGNTVLVVEHDEETILEADYILDLGPGAGVHGGEIVASGSPREILADPASLTGRYLSGALRIPVPSGRRTGQRFLTIKGAAANNLRDIDVQIPLGVFTCVTGVSGSGKSTLVIDTLFRALGQRLYRSKEKSGKVAELLGLEHLDKVIDIDQSPIGRTPRSNPATYTGVFSDIRDLFAQLPEAKMRGYKPGRFSFNVKGGRCEACQGDGILKIEMHFLPDVYVTCEVCRGARYNRETLEIKYKGKSIAEVLDLTVNQAAAFLENIPRIRTKLETLREVGIGYIKLGQSATTLSGGEAQRIKLAKELSRRATGRTIYILDEPTTGLHFADIQKLLDVLQRLVDAGNTVVVIEHNLDVIKTADHVIDLGPEGGSRGGELVACGTPEEVARHSRSHTGRYLRAYLNL
ncbi:Excinuclease ABC subunit A [Geoalkalibacter ferrihydriticus]|uniref:UvrABC system protein A n=2 Tax=Geoalkalibacter ferrihydriticus TaxID=392333 RepID=A0A0C2HYI6_9BACT|nr:excinuclease ABC subunit UvrA [Geoalkalibacter ferrihydriticus]KIH77822.1 excinuclease ABC subunit A [Geoalkalibacter ferrihydriticus DSM 17813]SDL80940.1 Excinuclease ABC subunit A [Geoalkalibacter ferrihydriticus]